MAIPMVSPNGMCTVFLDDQFNAVQLAGPNDSTHIHPLRGTKRVYKGSCTLCMSVVCLAECYLFSSDTSSDDALPCWKDCRAEL